MDFTDGETQEGVETVACFQVRCSDVELDFVESDVVHFLNWWGWIFIGTRLVVVHWGL